jgi:hypothetical protein
MNDMLLKIISGQLQTVEQKLDVIGNMVAGKIEIRIAAIIKESPNGEPPSKMIVTGIEHSPEGLVIKVK